MPPLSKRIAATDPPCIVQMQKMLAGKKDVLSLAQGIVYWQPPEAALEAAAKSITEPRVSMYGADDGLPELKEALKLKLAQENELTDVEVIVTAGANQAFMNVVLTLMDETAKAVLFAPYYFNHLMALQMTGAEISIGECDDNMIPDMDKLKVLLSKGDVRMVVICNPCNPSGVVTPKAVLQKAADLCAKAGAWLVVDNTYEYFTYDGAVHECVGGDNVLNLFSFSKAFGMMGWRVGFIAFPSLLVKEEAMKCQDTIPVCATILSQIVALASTQGAGRAWVQEKVEGLADNRAIVRAALTPLGEAAITQSNGAIYMWARLPADCPDDVKIVEWLAEKHGVCVIPGTACGVPGHIRVAFANLPLDKCKEASARLERGLHQLVTDGNM
eukprot:CAMPEP_0198202990 /NCGR_PEP_ID=MMETSP1445-20131203/6219_1 /TAXON_ID=36898 /ORGANISM="Pyramimonas sp., Strain CCMP2087" /LENGTH=385 /DNA_ID=CAMNT_0043874175 /DNA_START=211 /DNA_END=1368 /DNA_ORIENTATION=+